MKQVTQKYRSASTYGENIDGNCDGTPKSTTSIATKVYSDMPAHSFPSQCNETPKKHLPSLLHQHFPDGHLFLFFFFVFSSAICTKVKKIHFFVIAHNFFAHRHMCASGFSRKQMLWSPIQSTLYRYTVARRPATAFNASTARLCQGNDGAEGAVLEGRRADRRYPTQRIPETALTD